MTNSYLTRVMTFIKDDILKVQYDVDGITTDETNLTVEQTGEELIVYFFIGDTVIGVIDNFKLIGTTETIDIRNKTYTKTTDDTQRIALEYKLEVKVV